MLGERIRKIREGKNLKLSALAEMAGISPGYLSDIEKGNKKNPTMDKLQCIADALQVPVSEFLSTEEKLNITMDSLKNIHSIAKEASEKHAIDEKPINKINKLIKENKIETIAAHFEGEQFTDDDVEDIENFIKFILSKNKR